MYYDPNTNKRSIKENEITLDDRFDDLNLILGVIK